MFFVHRELAQRQRHLGCFDAAVELFTHGARTRFALGFDAQNFMDNGDIGFQANAHERIRNGAEDLGGVKCFALPEKAKGEDGIELPGPREALGLERDFKRAGNPHDRLPGMSKSLFGRPEHGPGVHAMIFAYHKGKMER